MRWDKKGKGKGGVVKLVFSEMVDVFSGQAVQTVRILGAFVPPTLANMK